MPLGTRCVLQSVNFPGKYLRPGTNFSYLGTKEDALQQGGEFELVRGLDGAGVFFRSVTRKLYLRHQNYTLKLASGPRSSSLFREDATFRLLWQRDDYHQSLAQGPDMLSFRSQNFPDRYIRHYRGRFEVSSRDYRKNTPFDQDASFVCSQITNG